MLVGLAAVRESVDQLAAQLVASQQQMATDIAALKATQQGVLDKISSAPPPRPAAARPATPLRTATPQPGGAPRSTQPRDE